MCFRKQLSVLSVEHKTHMQNVENYARFIDILVLVLLPPTKFKSFLNHSIVGVISKSPGIHSLPQNYDNGETGRTAKRTDLGLILSIYNPEQNRGTDSRTQNQEYALSTTGYCPQTKSIVMTCCKSHHNAFNTDSHLLLRPKMYFWLLSCFQYNWLFL